MFGLVVLGLLAVVGVLVVRIRRLRVEVGKGKGMGMGKGEKKWFQDEFEWVEGKAEEGVKGRDEGR